MRPRPLPWLVAALALAGCDDSLGGFPCDGYLCFDVGPGPDRPDMTPACAPDEREVPGLGCTAQPTEAAELCALTQALELDCEDLDGDCAPERCAEPPPAEIADWLLDCDGSRSAVWPGATERCDGLDNDCDGEVDEGLGLGEACNACARSGTWECATDGSGQRACSAEAGQSQAPADGEICDGVDNDCDGQTDEACEVPLALTAPRHPAVCGSGQVVLVADGALWSLTEAVDHTWSGGPVEAATSDVPAAYPACSPSLLAWLTTPEACEAPADGPAWCPRASVWALDTDQAFDLTGQATPGRPAVRDDVLMWHALVGDRPVLKRHDRGQRGVQDVSPDLPLSDPAPLGPARWAARQWVGGQAEGVLWAGEAFDQGIVPVRPSGPPAASDRWMVWALGEQALWAVPLTGEGRTGFQLTASPGPHRAPRVVGDHVVWIHGGVLRHTDLRTGISRVLFEGEVAPDDLAAGPGGVAWIAQGEAGPALFVQRLTD